MGWVMIFSDGRVLRGDGNGTEVRVHLLTQAGLDLVRTGRVTAHDVFFDTSFDRQPDASSFPDDSAFDRHVVWADQSPRQYVPTQFAACPFESGSGWVPAARVVLRLPDAVRDAVLGTQRNIPIEPFEQMKLPADWFTEEECFVLNAEQVLAIAKFSVGRSQAVDVAEPQAAGERFFTFTKGYRQERLNVFVTPVLPDGSTVRPWGGG